MIIIKTIILYFIQMTHTDDFPSTCFCPRSGLTLVPCLSPIDAIEQATDNAADKLQKEKQEQDRLQQEVAELRSKLAQGER